MARPLLDSTRIAPEAIRTIEGFNHAVVLEVQAAVEKNAVVVVGMAQNPAVKKARAALTQAGIPFAYLEYGSYLSEWRKRLAIKLWSGYPTFPQVFVKGTLIGGGTETVASLADGSLKRRLE